MMKTRGLSLPVFHMRASREKYKNGAPKRVEITRYNPDNLNICAEFIGRPLTFKKKIKA